MKLFADESIDGPIVARLRGDGHDVIWIAEESPGIADQDVLARACQADVLLITNDKDFGELVYRNRQPHAGVLLLRISGANEETKCDLVSQTISQHGAAIEGAFSVLSEHDVRIRIPPTSNP
jgi:predicted nuclease of predicted toxin-antitoxin system